MSIFSLKVLPAAWEEIKSTFIKDTTATKSRQPMVAETSAQIVDTINVPLAKTLLFDGKHCHVEQRGHYCMDEGTQLG